MALRIWQVAVIVGALLAAASAQAQQGLPPGMVPEEVPTDPAPAADPNVTTLGEVRAINPDDEPLDLYRFKNPVKIENNRFSKSWREPPSPEQVSQAGGYVMMGINYGLGMAAKGVGKLTNAPAQIQSAVARPPPLSEEEARRAMHSCQDDCGAANPVD